MPLLSATLVKSVQAIRTEVRSQAPYFDHGAQSTLIALVRFDVAAVQNEAESRYQA